MKTEIGTEWAESRFQFVYRWAEHSFTAVPKPDGGISSVLVNDLQLEVNDNGTVLYVWGLFPRVDKCNPTVSCPPNAKQKKLRFVSDDGWIPGVSLRLNKTHWDVFANKADGWVCVGNPKSSTNSIAIEFAPSSIAVLENNAIIAVWLKPVR